MEVNQIISKNLKRLRTERGLSLGQLATLSDISKVMLSQIEKGESNPTINTLWKVANGLKVSYTALLEQHIHDTTIVQKSDIAIQKDDDDHYRLYCYYATTPQRNFEQFQIELDAGYTHTTSGHCEKSQEYVMVLEGTLELVVDTQHYLLHPNDAISFLASFHHSYTAVGTDTLKILVTNYYSV